MKQSQGKPANKRISVKKKAGGWGEWDRVKAEIDAVEQSTDIESVTNTK